MNIILLNSIICSLHCFVIRFGNTFLQLLFSVFLSFFCLLQMPLHIPLLISILILCYPQLCRNALIKTKPMEFLLFLGYFKTVFLFAGKRLLVLMGWLTKILKGSSHKFSDGQYNKRYREDRTLDSPRYSAVYECFFVYMLLAALFFFFNKDVIFEVKIKGGFFGFLIQDGSDFDKEEIECAIALSLSEQDHVIPQDDKGKKVIGKAVLFAVGMRIEKL